MSAKSASVVRSFAVGRRTCTFTLPRPRAAGVLAAVVEWSPDPPTRLSTAEMAQYRAGRNAAVAELGRLLGERIALFEL